MYQYTIDKVTRLSGTDVMTAVLDLGFSVKSKETFKLARVEAPETDFFYEGDTEAELRSQIVNWVKNAAKPIHVQMTKTGKDYVAELIDAKGRVMADTLAPTSEDDTQFIPRYDSAVQATTDPSSF